LNRFPWIYFTLDVLVIDGRKLSRLLRILSHNWAKFLLKKDFFEYFQKGWHLYGVSVSFEGILPCFRLGS